MKYKIPYGYVIPTEKAEELALKYNLNTSQKNALYRYLLDKAKECNKKYNDNPNSRIWLLDINSVNEQELINFVTGNNVSQISLLEEVHENINENKYYTNEDIKYRNDKISNSLKTNTTIINFKHPETLNLIYEISNSNLDDNTKLKIIKIICNNN